MSLRALRTHPFQICFSFFRSGKLVRICILFTMCALVLLADGRTANCQEKKSKTKEKPKPKLVDLIQPKTFPAGWLHHSAEKTSALKDTWKVDAVTDKSNPVLICTGKPSGYLRTVKAYENFELTLEWMYPPNSPNCNSGILVHVQGTDKIWPASIQVQLHRPQVGSIFPLRGAKTDNQVSRMGQMLASKKWHSCKIISMNGSISVTINGKKVGEVTGCEPKKGFIAFQSEGSEIHFRKIQIREIVTPIKKKTAPVTATSRTK
ncbi:MAG: hypothetical protein Tsb009_24140 [Planctomycetaceae bacterium]